MKIDIKKLNEELLPGPWWAEENEYSWDLYAMNPIDPRMHPFKIIKAPKKSTEYAEYWPTGVNEKIIIAAPLLYEAALAADKYDDAIRECADDPDKMATFCTARGDDLDDLYMDWIAKVTTALHAVKWGLATEMVLEKYKEIWEELAKR